MEQRLRSASSVDELMTLIYPSYWATLKCTSKLSSAAASSRSRFAERQQPPASTEDPVFSAVYLNLDVLKSTTFYVRFHLKRAATFGCRLHFRPWPLCVSDWCVPHNRLWFFFQVATPVTFIRNKWPRYVWSLRTA